MEIIENSNLATILVMVWFQSADRKWITSPSYKIAVLLWHGEDMSAHNLV